MVAGLLLKLWTPQRSNLIHRDGEGRVNIGFLMNYYLEDDVCDESQCWRRTIEVEVERMNGTKAG